MAPDSIIGPDALYWREGQGVFAGEGSRRVVPYGPAGPAAVQSCRFLGANVRMNGTIVKVSGFNEGYGCCLIESNQEGVNHADENQSPCRFDFNLFFSNG